MQLTFSRTSLTKSLRLFFILFALFVAATAYAIWVDEPDFKRSVALILMPAASAICAWAIAKTIWMMRSQSPAAVIENDGLRIHTFAGTKVISWDKLGRIGKGFMPAGKTMVDVIDIQSDKRKTIRNIPLNSLDGSEEDVSRWIAAAQSRLAA